MIDAYYSARIVVTLKDKESADKLFKFICKKYDHVFQSDEVITVLDTASYHLMVDLWDDIEDEDIWLQDKITKIEFYDYTHLKYPKSSLLNEGADNLVKRHFHPNYVKPVRLLSVCREEDFDKYMVDFQERRLPDEPDGYFLCSTNDCFGCFFWYV